MAPVNRLKPKDLQPLRQRLLESQSGICPLCQTEILPDEAVLDHDHSRGHIRRVLHRSCNYAEGLIRHWATRTKASNPVDFVGLVLGYWGEDFSENPLHPSHRTEEEREVKRLKKHLKTLKTEKGRQAVRDAIEQLIARTS